MNQLLRLVCFSVSYSGESSPNLPFIANKQYSLRYNVGVFDNEVRQLKGYRRIPSKCAMVIAFDRYSSRRLNFVLGNRLPGY